MSRTSQEKYKSLGLCAFCGKNPPRKNRISCERCGRRQAECTKNNKQKCFENGVCCKCRTRPIAAGNKRYCEDCYRKHLAGSKRSRDKLRDEVFAAYGGYKCACCGETEANFLSIDHINNDGEKHRKEVGNVYHWLKKNNYPPGFQVLCFNCNMGKKACGGICPHKLKGKSCELNL